MSSYPARWYYVGAWGEQWIERCKRNVSRTSNREKYWVHKLIPNMYEFMCRLAYEKIELRDEGDHLVLCCIGRLQPVG
jgi:hypothetical protein